MYTKTKIKKKLAVFLCMAVTISTIISNTGVVSATGTGMQQAAQETDISVISGDNTAGDGNEPGLISNEDDSEAETSPQVAEENITDAQEENEEVSESNEDSESSIEDVTEESLEDSSDEETKVPQEDGQTEEQSGTQVTTEKASDDTAQSTESSSTEGLSSEAETSVAETTQAATQPETQKPTEYPSTEQPSTEQPSTEQPSTEQPTTDAALALLMLRAANKVTFAYNAYPYGMISGSNITLTTALSKGTAVSVQWYRADSKDGTYTAIDGATELTYTFSAVSGTTYWYKCNVNGYDTYPVQVIHGSQSTSDSIYIHDQGSPLSAWYISNGTMAYTNGVGGGSYPAFDVIGTYLYNGISSMTNQTYIGQNLWISTSYSGGWKMNSDTDYIICTFDPNDAHSVKCKAVLKEGGSTFGLYADVCLGSSSLFSSLADSASLKTILEEVNGTKKASQVQMVGAATVDDAVVTDPAFVLGCIDKPDTFFVGSYSAASYKYTSYNTSISGSGVKAHEIIDGTDVVTEVAGIDSGFAMGWQNITKGYVDFAFNIGSVEQTGAQITANSKVTSKTITVTQEDGEVGAYRYRLYDKVAGTYTEWKIPDSETREVVFDNLTPNHTYEIFMEEIATGKTDSMGDTTTAIDPVNPGTGSGEDTPAVETSITYNTIAFKHLNADYQYRLLDEDENPASNWYSVSGDDNEVTFIGLTPGTDYYLVAKTDGNSQTDKVLYTTDKITITYADNVDGEDIEVPSSHEYSYADLLSSIIPVRTAYDFLGWNYEENRDSDYAEFLVGESTYIEEPVTLYACWKIKTYTVTVSSAQQYTVDAESAAVEHGSDYTITLSPVAGYILSDVKASVNNGEYTTANVTYDEAAGKYKITITNVTEDKLVTVSCDFTTLLANAQRKAREEIEDTVADALSQIEALDRLTDDEKTIYKSKINAIRDHVLMSIDVPTDPADEASVEIALSQGKQSISQIVNEAVNEALSEAKANAYADLTEKAQAAISQIKALPDLTVEEMQSAIAKIEEQRQEAQALIDNISDYDEITSLDNIVSDFDDTLAEDITDAKKIDLSNAKTKAEAAIDDMVSEADQIIDGLTDLTASEKAAAKKSVSDSAKAAKADIAKITDYDRKSDISSVLSTEETAVEKHKTEAKKTDLANAKTKAEAVIDEIAAEAIDRIDALTDLTDAEKVAAKKDISDKAKNAKADIEKITDPDDKADITALKTTGAENIGQSEKSAKELDLSNAKESAIAQIEAARKTACDAVDALTDLSDKEKASEKQKINESAAAAVSQIESISTPENKNIIGQYVAEGKSNISEDEKSAKELDLSNAKSAAVTKVEEEVRTALNKIDELTDLTEEQKEAARKEIENRAAMAYESINNITIYDDKADISTSVTAAASDITSSTQAAIMKDLSNARDTAKAAVEEAVKNTNELIDGLEDLSNIEKTAAKNKVAARADEAKAKIDAIVSPDKKSDIEQIVSEGEAAVADEGTKAVKLDLSNARESGKSEIDKIAQDIITEIKQLTDLTEDELNAAIEKIEQLADNYKSSINEVTNPEDKGDIAEIVKAAKSEMNLSFDTTKATDLSNAKSKAADEVMKAADESRLVINGLTDITDEQRNEALEKIENSVKNAISDINAVKDPDDKAKVTECEEKYIEEIKAAENIAKNQDIVNAKEKAYAVIDENADNAKAEIGTLTDLTDAQLRDIYEDIDRKAEAAKEAIDSVTEHENKSQIEAEKNTGNAFIENTITAAKNLELSNVKETANEAIEARADEAKKALDELTDLTEEEKAAAKEAIDKQAEEAKAAVAAVTSPENKKDIAPVVKVNDVTISRAEDEAISQDFVNAKNNARNDIEKNAEEAKKAIDAMPGFTNVEKAAAKAQIDEEAKKAKEEIENITNPLDKTILVNKKESITAFITDKKQEMQDISKEREDDDDDTAVIAPSEGVMTPEVTEASDAQISGADENSTEASQSGNTGTDANAGTAADTSDNSPVEIWLLLMVGSMMLFIAGTKKRQENK